MMEPTHIHGFTISASPTRRLIGIEASQQGAFSPEAAEAVADALRAAAANRAGRAAASTPRGRAGHDWLIV